MHGYIYYEFVQSFVFHFNDFILFFIFTVHIINKNEFVFAYYSQKLTNGCKHNLTSKNRSVDRKKWT